MNPLLAVVKGISKTTEDAAKSVRRRAVESVMPNPSMAYNLGMGIGPMLQAIVTEIKKKDGKKDEGAAEKANVEKQVALESKKQTKLLSTQLSSMVTILKDIKNIGLVQLRNEQLKAFESRKQQYTSKIQQILGGKETEQGPTEKKGIFGGSFGGSMLSSLGEVLPSLLKLLVGGGAMYALWEYVFDEKTRNTIKEFVFGKDIGGKSITELVTERIIGAWKASFDENPLTTIVGTGIAAWATGLLGVLGVAGKIAWGGGKLVYNIGAFVGNKAFSQTPSTIPTNTTAPPPSGSIPTNQPSSTLPAKTTRTSVIIDPKTGKGFEIQEGGPTSKLPSPSATPTGEVAKATSMWAKAGETIAKAGSVVSKALGVVGTGFSAVAAADEYKQGKNWSAGLYAASALFGTGALATGLSGVLAPAAPVLGGLSLVTGTLAAITSYFEKGNTSQAKGPQPAATDTSAVANAPAMEYKKGWTGDLSQQDAMKLIQAKFGSAGYNSAGIWAAIANAARESSLGQNMHTDSPKEDSWGLFQMNRKGGMGAGYTSEQLLDPAFNTDLLINGLKQAEQGAWGEYKKGVAMRFRNAQSKEEAAEALREFLHGRATAEQKLEGQQRQAKVNQMIESGKFGKLPDLVTGANQFAGTPSQYMPGTSQISSTNVEGSDARNATMLSEITNAVNDLMKAMTGGMTIVDQSNKSTNVSSSTSVGGGVPAQVNDTIKQKILYEVIYR